MKKFDSYQLTKFLYPLNTRTVVGGLQRHGKGAQISQIYCFFFPLPGLSFSNGFVFLLWNQFTRDLFSIFHDRVISTKWLLCRKVTVDCSETLQKNSKKKFLTDFSAVNGDIEIRSNSRPAGKLTKTVCQNSLLIRKKQLEQSFYDEIITKHQLLPQQSEFWLFSKAIRSDFTPVWLMEAASHHSVFPIMVAFRVFNLFV